MPNFICSVSINQLCRVHKGNSKLEDTIIYKNLILANFQHIAHSIRESYTSESELKPTIFFYWVKLTLKTYNMRHHNSL